MISVFISSKGLVLTLLSPPKASHLQTLVAKFIGLAHPKADKETFLLFSDQFSPFWIFFFFLEKKEKKVKMCFLPLGS